MAAHDATESLFWPLLPDGGCGGGDDAHGLDDLEVRVGKQRPQRGSSTQRGRAPR
jgi:hypothetical protein